MRNLNNPSPHFNDAEMARFCYFAHSSLLLGGGGGGGGRDGRLSLHVILFKIAMLNKINETSGPPLPPHPHFNDAKMAPLNCDLATFSLVFNLCLEAFKVELCHLNGQYENVWEVIGLISATIYRTGVSGMMKKVKEILINFSLEIHCTCVLTKRSVTNYI